jgi:hypothetical protein
MARQTLPASHIDADISHSDIRRSAKQDLLNNARRVTKAMVFPTNPRGGEQEVQGTPCLTVK